MSESPRTEKRAQRAIEAYGRTVRGGVRQFWNGTLDFDQAFDFMFTTVRIGLRNNWNAGAAECGITPAEMSPLERQTLQSVIARESSFIARFLADVETGSKANGGKLGVQLERSKMWAFRANDVQNQARTMACGDRKMIWIWDPAKEHCIDCRLLNGKVKRASFWRRSGILPQSQDLACKGFLCGCNLKPTNKPLSKGPLPRLRGPG